MNEGQLLQIGSQAMIMAAELAAPFLLVSLAIGLIVSLFQSVTQIQEVTLTFVPKLGATALVLLIGGHWMLTSFTSYTDQLFGQINTLLGG
jgi:flagellar biosynthesis protein FliQ